MDNDNRATEYTSRDRARANVYTELDREATNLTLAAKALPPEFAAAAQWLLGRAAGIRHALNRGAE